MCGIAGYLSRITRADDQTAAAMARAIAHRGPDSSGTWCDAEAGVALGHRRLSILDLSEAGHQPMVSVDGRLVVTFNGEIYNHHELRAELEASGWTSPWRGHSDTETLVAALQRWGLAGALGRLNGMFAFALWDRERRVLQLARDRIGEKPLYYGSSRGSFLFGSELKALTAHPDWAGEIDADALTLYMRHGYIPEPHSIYRGIGKLPPAHFVEIDPDDPGAAQPVAYWSPREIVGAPRREASRDELLGELKRRLSRAVGLRMEADVPLGAFLSGGIDSTTVVALMQAQSARPVRTFTIGFDVPGFNEADEARRVAAHLGTDHSELYVTPQDALEVVPKLPAIWDEPFSDSSQIPTLLLSTMTREHVTVALSGDGGDELFCGYSRFQRGHALERALRHLPRPFVRTAAAVLRAVPAHAVDGVVRSLPGRLGQSALGDRMHKLGDLLEHARSRNGYRALLSQCQDPAALVLGGREPATILGRDGGWPAMADFRECMMYLDTVTYLPGDILTKVDRASMAVSLEARVPFLDHELMEFVWTLPFDMKLRGGETKWALRRLLERHVPRALTERPKKGFSVPIEHWLSGPLRDWAESLLDERRLREEGHLDPAAIRRLWDEHSSGRRRWHHQLWSVLMFQDWLEHARTG